MMDKYKILENSLCAVNFKQTEARNQVRHSRDLGNEEAAQFWEKEVEKAEAAYCGLLEMLSDLYSGSDSSKPLSYAKSETESKGNSSSIQAAHEHLISGVQLLSESLKASAKLDCLNESPMSMEGE